MSTAEEKIKAEKAAAEAEAEKAKKESESQGDGSQDVTLSDEQWANVFKHPRFKDLNERATKAEKELEKFNKAKAEAEETKLKEEKKWQELAEKKDKEVETLNARVTLASQTRSIIEEAIKLGIKDTDAAVKLVDIKDIELDEEGKPTNAAEVVKALATAKPYLITGEPAKDIGANINPDTTDGQKKVWKSSELRMKMRDASWYKKHRKEIGKAYSEGRVDNTK